MAHVTGVGSFPPVADTIAVIEQLVPAAKSVGTLYNSSEANSRKVISVARELFTKRGIKLEEVTVTGTSDVAQAAQVLAGRNIQALWITGDKTALQAFDAIANATTRVRSVICRSRSLSVSLPNGRAYGLSFFGFAAAAAFAVDAACGEQ